MKIEITTINESPTEKSLHLRILTPDGNNYNFRVPKSINGEQDDYSFIYPYQSMKELHQILDKFING